MTITEFVAWLDSNDAIVEMLEAWDLTLDMESGGDLPPREQVRMMLLRVAEEVRALDQPPLAESVLAWLLSARLCDYLVEQMRAECDRLPLPPRPITDYLHMVRLVRDEISERMRVFCRPALNRAAGDGESTD